MGEKGTHAEILTRNSLEYTCAKDCGGDREKIQY
jgi:hypothetical protein